MLLKYLICSLKYLICPLKYLLCPLKYLICPLKYLICPLKYLICALKSSRRRARRVEAANNNWLWSLCTRSVARKVWTGEQLQLEQTRNVMLGHREFETQSGSWWIYDALDLDTPNQCCWRAFASLRQREDKEKILQNIPPGSKRRCASTRWTTRSRRPPRSSASTTRRSAAGWRSRRSRTSAQTSATSSEKKVGFSSNKRLMGKAKISLWKKSWKEEKLSWKKKTFMVRWSRSFNTARQWWISRDICREFSHFAFQTIK